MALLVAATSTPTVLSESVYVLAQSIGVHLDKFACLTQLPSSLDYCNSWIRLQTVKLLHRTVTLENCTIGQVVRLLFNNFPHYVTVLDVRAHAHRSA